MKRFYERFSESDPKVQQAVALLPWGHTLKLMQKFGDDNEAILYYAQETTAKGWSRDLLTSAISGQMHLRKNEPADNNFALTLPADKPNLPMRLKHSAKSCPTELNCPCWTANKAPMKNKTRQRMRG